MRQNVIQEKSLAFAIKVVKICQHLISDRREYVLSKQLLRSATSVGAMVREAEHSESKKDFIHKLAIAQKEINETIYWLELMKATDYLQEETFNYLNTDAIEILKIITRIIKTSKFNS